MASNTFSGAIRSFWHTMTSNDRHASPRTTPYRGGQHILTSVTANTDESRTNLATALDRDDAGNSGTFFSQPTGPATPGSPYTPGLRSSMQRRQSGDASSKGNASAEVQMQTFSDGLPPPPPVKHSWRRIDRWCEDNYGELFDNISGGCTQNDINELEHDLDCTLPQDVRDSLTIHDGQERGGVPTGIIFGSMLMDCEEIVQEWKNWRRVNDDILNATVHQAPPVPSKAFGSGEGSSSNPPPAATPAANSNWREELAAKQDSQPANAVQKSYAHPAWIPLVRDWGGNNIAVDLAPGPAGKWGQVILMGRDYDCKYVIARSWAAFLAIVADDISSRKTWIEEESGALKLREFKGQNIEPAYFDILRWRTDQKYGRKPPRRRSSGSNGDLRLNSNVPAVVSRGSPYSTEGDRGRSPHRFSGKGLAAQSPRATLSSPLARVAEETPAAVAVHMDSPSRKASEAESEALIGGVMPHMSEIDVPKVRDFAVDGPAKPSSADKENQKTTSRLSGLSLTNVDVGDHAGELKTVDI